MQRSRRQGVSTTTPWADCRKTRAADAHDARFGADLARKHMQQLMLIMLAAKWTLPENTKIKQMMLMMLDWGPIWPQKICS